MHMLTSHGISMPALGFGTWQLRGETARHMVAAALEAGYRHIDTAQIYENEEAVGQGIADAGVPREALFLTTKVWVDRFAADDLRASVTESLERLKVAHVDLLLLHWPAGEVPLAETIAALNAELTAGRTRAIGISNFTVALIREAVSLSAAPLICNQVEYHPYLDQGPVLAELARHGMGLVAYSPVAQGKVATDPLLTEIGARHGKTAGQVALRWLVQQPQVAAIPRSSSPTRMRENFDIFDFTLSDAEMGQIRALARPDGRLVTPGHLAPAWD